jgi:uncharacterized protein YbdZ (MbtH family)
VSTFDVGISIAAKSVQVPLGWRAYQGGGRQSEIITAPAFKAVLVPPGWKVVNPASANKAAVPWNTIITAIEAVIAKYGPAAVPIVEKMLADSNLPPFVVAIIDQLLDAAVNPAKAKRRKAG